MEVLVGILHDPGPEQREKSVRRDLAQKRLVVWRAFDIHRASKTFPRTSNCLELYHLPKNWNVLERRWKRLSALPHALLSGAGGGRGAGRLPCARGRDARRGC